MQNIKQMKKPNWLRKGFPAGKKLHDLKLILRKANLHSICEEAMCPNISECFAKKTATFLILGNVCTRDCRYCNVLHAKTRIKLLPVEKAEPKNIAKTVKKIGLSYVVITSVTRDDLLDYGAYQFTDTLNEIRKLNKKTKIEALIPDFLGSADALKAIITARPDVISHNIETVKEQFRTIRPQGRYELSITLLSLIKKFNRSQKTKSGLMIGMGETYKTIVSALKDLRKADVDFLSIGQYLQPSRSHLPVKKYYTPAEFERIKKKAYALGFLHVESGPFVRSSYNADKLKRFL
jgi:lipoic acid synthetase